MAERARVAFLSNAKKATYADRRGMAIASIAMAIPVRAQAAALRALADLAARHPSITW